MFQGGTPLQTAFKPAGLLVSHLAVLLGDVLQFSLCLHSQVHGCLEFLVFLTHFFLLSGDLQQGLHLHRGQMTRSSSRQ